ncbi:MAG TPA: TlpA disulfide reductase family protein [Stellaceae bacterium]|nr:TlpA disulfide reductase family protein [Stellaceae bacterium]
MRRVVIGGVVIAIVLAGAVAWWRRPAPLPNLAEAPLGELIPLATPVPAPAVTFTTRAGEPKTLGDFRGRLILVNLWASWCAPCVREMPSLDRAQGALGADLTILAISEDRGGAEKVDPFLAQLGLHGLTSYLDPGGEVGRAFGARGLPTSFLIDKEGRILAKLEGEAPWDDPKMLSRLEAYAKGE